MSIYLYRAVALEHVDHAHTGEPMFWPGMPLGRATGYLSRSSAVDAGDRAGVAFRVVRSLPVIFPVLPEVELAEAREQIATLREQLTGRVAS